MNPRILERIALYADIDTRRALGMYGKITKTDFQFPYTISNSNPYFTHVTFSRHVLLLTSHYARWSRTYHPAAAWKFFFKGKECCTLNENDGKEFYVHPDFHEDGSFKRSRL